MREERARSNRWETCLTCGQQNGDWETRCQKCGRPLSEARNEADSPATAGPSGSPAGLMPAAQHRSHRRPVRQASAPAFPEHLRQQLQNRVQHFRSRKGSGTPALPFEDQPAASPKVISFPELAASEQDRKPASPAMPQRPERTHRSPAAAGTRPQASLNFHHGALPDQVWRSRPVAPLRLRLAAHGKDLQIVAGAVLLFLAALPLIPYSGVALRLDLLLAGGIACASLLLSLGYSLLFAWGSGVTPGMRHAGLRLVSFDGLAATRRQRLWRILGGIVSAGSFLIGYLWAVVDEEKLYWHDHISKTYLTLADS